MTRSSARLLLNLGLAAVAGLPALSAASAQAEILLNNGPAAGRVKVVSYRDLPFRTVVRQQYDFSCGSAALATLLRHHYGRDVGEAQVFRAMFADGDQETIRRVGFSLLDMKRYLDARGYPADGFRLSLDELIEMNAPAIVMIDTAGYKHFVVFKGDDAGHVLVGDPALGLKIYSRDQFTAMWNGVAFVVRQPADTFNDAEEWRIWNRSRPGQALQPMSLAELTRELPPLYQVTTRFSLDPYLR
ncbi:ABC-type bacteriocin/lantibiotic exporters, contain an N-terminal double-glycine peptidase domain [Brevundimonas diminuta]|uniref:C39 family peptidase n=1 Tax=Brevundimonas TaxID=41275 RepID=UPI000207EB4D|nr:MULTISPECIES: C39 family peptidase [Brevundimonas]EGF96671.1 peptidase C39 family protein [Brevundimonas diminuta ATCC 11568]WQE44700.1 C39 family peptidase [Brevundimonas diminuta]SPU45556.1 ABC-type bacteriocin/lantibiotic exporters, contain an N-terminal double-glycine peptidase domain [Brevundimonas diminuta]SUW17216.1 ABC-type bacteriocin/lantibiotic exporters, contain an N-terminal double-glycine peptidase domain [Brevundimonas diminuta]HRL06798.1 C39 family peptidase [Brevundimonas d